jgi:hypothetical protein
VDPRRVEITRGDAGFGFNLSKSEGSHFLRKVSTGLHCIALCCTALPERTRFQRTAHTCTQTVHVDCHCQPHQSTVPVWNAGGALCDGAGGVAHWVVLRKDSSDIPAVTTTETDVTLYRLDPPLPQVDDGGAAWLGGARSGDRILAVSGGDSRSGQLAFT